MFINCGAYIMGVRPKTKKALKEAMRDTPTKVLFDCTDAFGPNAGRRFDGDHVPPGATLVVVGPDPHTKRNWYANVTSKKVS